MVNESLKSKTTIGLLWSLIDMFFNQGLTFIVQIILARLLLPESFGVIAIVMIFIAIANTLVDSGFSQALIREKKVDKKDYDTIFSFNLAVSVLIFLILYITAPLIEGFFLYDNLTLYIRSVSIVIIFNAFSIIPKVMLMRELNFKTFAKVGVLTNVISSLFAIVLAIAGLGVWALIIQKILAQLSQCILLAFLKRWKPRISFSILIFRKYLNFSYKLLLSGLIDTLYNQLVVIIIGKQYTQAQLGYYSHAEKLKDSISLSITAAIQKVTYPVLSKINTNYENEKLKQSYQKLIRLTAFFSIPIMLGLVGIADPLFLLLFGERWSGAVFYFQLLCIAGMLYPLHALNLNILQVKGRSDLFLLLEIIKKIIGIIFIIISLILNAGINGLVIALVVYSFAAYIVNTYFTKKIIEYSLLNQLQDIKQVLVVSIFMMSIVLIVTNIIEITAFFKVILGIFLGITIFVLISKLLKNREYYYCEKQIIKLLKRRFKI